MKKLIIPEFIISNNSKDEILSNSIVEVDDQIISKICKKNEYDFQSFMGEIIDAQNLVLIPGFIQTHIHLCQTLFRGLADDLELLDWLQKKIFPFENAHDKNSLSISVMLGLFELMKSGTTTILDMGTMRHQEIIFDELINSGFRAIAGKCMVDENELFPEFKSDTKVELNYSYQLAKHYHNQYDGRIKYGFAPRFVLSCSENLLKETKEMMKDFPESIFHTHSSENKNEIAEVRKRYGKENIEYFDSLNTLDKNSVLAHCIHLNEKEIQILKDRNVKVSHCPSSNMKLGSGIADIPRYLKKGINVSISSDGAPCNNNLSQFNEMKLSALIQKPIHGSTSMDAKTIFKLATIEGAKALNLEKVIGSIEVGKKADLVLLDLNKPNNSFSEEPNSIYSNIVYSSSSENVVNILIDGKWKVQNGKSKIYDEKKLVADAKNELKKLLKRL